MEGYYVNEKNLAIGRTPSIGNDVHKESRYVMAMSISRILVPSLSYELLNGIVRQTQLKRRLIAG